jgi:glucokinase
MRDGQFYLGADLGGTSLRVGAVGADGTLAGVLSVSTGRDFGPQDLQAETRGLADRLERQLGVTEWLGVGFGTAGVVPDNGPLRHSDNLPKLVGHDVRKLLEETLGASVTIENDARCFTLAEARFGAARGAKDVCGITLGTGIGCGLILEGKLHRGKASQAGEVCTMPLRGRNLEYWVSTGGLLRAFAEEGGYLEGVDGARLAALARSGDPAACAAWRTFAADLGILCETVIALVEPEIIVIGGSLAQAHDLLDPVLVEALKGRSSRVLYGTLGPFAGVIGAAALARFRPGAPAAPSSRNVADAV